MQLDFMFGLVVKSKIQVTVHLLSGSLTLTLHYRSSIPTGMMENPAANLISMNSVYHWSGHIRTVGMTAGAAPSIVPCVSMVLIRRETPHDWWTQSYWWKRLDKAPHYHISQYKQRQISENKTAPLLHITASCDACLWFLRIRYTIGKTSTSPFSRTVAMHDVLGLHKIPIYKFFQLFCALYL